MTHEHVRMLLPRYAAGTVGDREADAVRAHIAAGCAQCLEELYRLPLGLPADAVGAHPDVHRHRLSADGAATPLHAPHPPAPPRVSAPWGAVLVGIAAATGALAYYWWAH